MSTTYTTKIDVGAVAGAMTRPLPEHVDAWLETTTGRVVYSARNIQQADHVADPYARVWIEPLELATRFAWARGGIRSCGVLKPTTPRLDRVGETRLQRDATTTPGRGHG